MKRALIILFVLLVIPVSIEAGDRTRLEIVDMARELINEVTNSNMGTAETSPYWSDTSLATWANIAVHVLQGTVGATEVETTYAIASGTDYYVLPSNFIAAASFEVQKVVDAPTIEARATALRQIPPDSVGRVPGKEESGIQFFSVFADSLVLDPVPQYAETGKLKYFRESDDLDTDATVSELDNRYAEIASMFVASMALFKTGNAGESKQLMDLFVGFRNEYKQLENAYRNSSPASGQ